MKNNKALIGTLYKIGFTLLCTYGLYGIATGDWKFENFNSKREIVIYYPALIQKDSVNIDLEKGKLEEKVK